MQMTESVAADNLRSSSCQPPVVMSEWAHVRVQHAMDTKPSQNTSSDHRKQEKLTQHEQWVASSGAGQNNFGFHFAESVGVFFAF